MLLTRKDFSGPLKFGLSGFHCIIVCNFFFYILHVLSQTSLNVFFHITNYTYNYKADFVAVETIAS
jgi:hypothetical protein